MWFLALLSVVQGCAVKDKPAPSFVQIEQRLEEEGNTDPSEPNSLAYRRAIGESPARAVSPREMTDNRLLTLDECLQLAFTDSSEIQQARQSIVAVGGSKLIVESRFLPSVALTFQYEHARNFGSANPVDYASAVFAQISQSIFEYGKDHPLDINLRAAQRDALFRYEDRVANVLSQVRKAFFFVKLKEQQMAARKQLLGQFEKQYEVKKKRMDLGNLSVKIEVLTANLNVLDEKSRINRLEREHFNTKVELLRLIGLPVGAEQVEFQGEMDRFALDSPDINGMVRLALAQSSQLAEKEAIVAEQRRALDQLRYEYIPDLGLVTGYQDQNTRLGTNLWNQNNTWITDGVGQAREQKSSDGEPEGLGLFDNGVSIGGPDPGWHAGAELRIPIFEGGARQGRRIQARAMLDRLIAALNDMKDRIEMRVRQRNMLLAEQKFQVSLAKEKVDIADQRFSIQTELRDVGKITDDELETFRKLFFEAQDRLFEEQVRMIELQENLRLEVRYFK